jgi:hypothetical protein
MKHHRVYLDPIFLQSFVTLLTDGMSVRIHLAFYSKVIDFSLKKSTTERADLNTLLVSMLRMRFFSS